MGISRIIAYVTILSFLFPYIKTSPAGSDIQIHVFGSSILYFVYFILKEKKLYINYIQLFVFLFLIILLLYLHASGLDLFRILFFFIIFYISIHVSKNYPDLIYKVLVFSVKIYLFGSFIQIVFGVDSLNIIVSNLRASDTRGLTSFASEPSFYGLVSLAQIVLLEFFQGEKYRFYQLLSIINLFMSASLTAIAPFFIILLIYYIKPKQIPILFIMIFIVLPISYNFISSHYPDMRIIKLVNLLINNQEILLQDVSLLNRLIRSLGPIYIAYSDNFSLHSFLNLESDFNRMIFFSNNISDDVEITRLSNLATYLIYPYGLIGLSLVAVYAFKIYKNNTPLFLYIAIIFFFLANISIVTPYAAMIFAVPFSVLKKNLQNSCRKANCNCKCNPPKKTIFPKVENSSKIL